MEGMFILSTVVVTDMEDIASGINFLHWYTGFFTLRIDPQNWQLLKEEN
jgi:hypothetical protein